MESYRIIAGLQQEETRLRTPVDSVKYHITFSMRSNLNIFIPSRHSITCCKTKRGFEISSTSWNQIQYHIFSNSAIEIPTTLVAEEAQ